MDSQRVIQTIWTYLETQPQATSRIAGLQAVPLLLAIQIQPAHTWTYARNSPTPPVPGVQVRTAEFSQLVRRLAPTNPTTDTHTKAGPSATPDAQRSRHAHRYPMPPSLGLLPPPPAPRAAHSHATMAITFRALHPAQHAPGCRTKRSGRDLALPRPTARGHAAQGTTSRQGCALHAPCALQTDTTT